jgi:hypothetical protein
LIFVKLKGKLIFIFMGQADEQLLRQVLAVLLYNRSFHRVSRPALDVFASVLEAITLLLWRRAARFAELSGNPVSLPLVLDEILRVGAPYYLTRKELFEYEEEQPELEGASVMEERGLLTGQLRILAGTRVDGKLQSVVVEPDAESDQISNRIV